MGIKQKLLSSSVWLVLEKIGSSLMALLIFLLLARFVGPADFGIVALAGIFVDLASLVAFAGLSQFLIQRRDWDDQLASTAFWLNMGSGVTLAALTAAIGIAVGQWSASAAGPVLSVLAIVLILDALRSVHEAKLRRDFGYRSLAMRTLLAKLISGPIGIFLAVSGWGLWALVSYYLIDAAAQTAVIWSVRNWWPKAHFSLKEARQLLHVGWRLSVSQIVNSITGLAPDVLIGAVLGPTFVGLYRVGSRGITMVRSVVVFPLQTTALSAFSRMPDEAGIGKAYLRVAGACAILTFPLHLGMAVIAHDFVAVTLGDAWMLSGDVMHYLSISGAFTSFYFLTQPALVAAGRPNLALFRSTATFLVTVAIAIATAFYGIIAVAMGACAAALLNSLLSVWALRRGLGLAPLSVVKNSATPFLASLAMMAVLVAVRDLILPDAAPLMRLLILVPAGVAIYGALMWASDRTALIRLWEDLSPLRDKVSARLQLGEE